MAKRISEKLTEWQNSYINIAINSKNNMLNQDSAKSDAVKLSTAAPFSYTMYWRIATGNGEADDYALESNAAFDPNYRPIKWEPLDPSKSNGQDRLQTLSKLAETCYNTIARKGENPLCITFGRLRWKAYNPRDAVKMDIDTPVILVPIKLNRQGPNFWLKPAYDEPMLNPALLLKYKSDGYLDFPIPECGQWLDDGFDIQKYFETLYTRFGEDNDDFKFDKDFVTLDLFDYDKFCMYSDVSRNMDAIEFNPIIRRIFGEENFVSPVKPVGLDKISPSEDISILDSDSSQSDVIEHFRAGESFILEGPPGTGKTQTIVNMISEALKNGKKVLFVSNKMSALSAVKKKMKMADATIDNHCLLVKGEGENKDVSIADIYEKLSAAYHSVSQNFDVRKPMENAENLEDYRSMLLKYKEEFYSSENSLGMSLYEIIGKMLSLGYNENTVPSRIIPLSSVEELTKKQLNALTSPMREIEALICAIFAKFGSVENDVWYGLREDAHTYTSDVAIRNGVQAIRECKTALDAAIKRASETDEAVVSTVVELLFAHPISAIVNLLKLDVVNDIESLYLNPKYVTQGKSRMQRYADAQQTYRSELEHYRSKTDNKNGEFEGISFDEPEHPFWEKLSIAKLSEELARARRIKQLDLGTTLTTHGTDPGAVIEISENVDLLLESLQTKAEIRGRLSNFTEDIFTFEYKPLLEKFRTGWQEHLKSNDGTPLFYNFTIRKLKKLCSNAIEAEFDMQTVYRLLEDLDKYHANENAIGTALETLKKYGIIYNSAVADQLSSFGSYLKDYTAELTSHALAVILDGTPSFSEYLGEKITSLENILKLAKNLCLTDTSVTLSELRALLSDYRTLVIYNEGIRNDVELSYICPSIPKNVFTDWQGMRDLLSLIEEIRDGVGGGNTNFNEHFAKFTKTIRIITETGLCGYVEKIHSLYNAFYSNNVLFDPEVAGDTHFRKTLTYKDIETWLDDVSNADYLSQYIQFKEKVKALPEISRAFFDFYAAEGRLAYPIDKLGNNYEIALLYAYYSNLVAKGDAVARLSGQAGVTTIETVIKNFAAADEAAIKWNRKILSRELSDRITRSNSPTGNIHTYLSAVPTGRAASVRRLFARRSESILELTPCIMMSVYSVSKLLDFGKYKFDVVIFDEASQIPEADALTAIMRTETQLIISGDPKQMPAFDYFKESVSYINYNDDDDDGLSDTCSSILDFVITIPGTKLGYYRLNVHYRSNHESLIKYSNEHPGLYGGNLITFPSPKARSRDFGLWDFCLPDMAEFSDTAITGGYGENESEVELMMKLIREHFEKYPAPETEADVESYEKSLGIIVFGEKQAKLLRDTLQKSSDPILKKVSGISDNRIFSITPVDKIQGDEMDEMILSLTYGRDSSGSTTFAWGPMIRQDGTPLRKFNVAVTRAKSNLKFLHSIRASEITNETLDYVKRYLSMMENFKDNSFISKPELNSDFVSVIGKICEDTVGSDRVVYNFGESDKTYRVPISILNKEKTEIVLGILCEVNRDGFSVREYTRSCPGILADQGWDNLHTTYAIQWIRNYAYEKRVLEERLRAVLDSPVAIPSTVGE